MGIIELFEMGFIAAFWGRATPPITELMYFFVVVGFALQFIFEKKSRKPAVRWSVFGLCICCIFISECVWQFSRDQMGSDILYLYLIDGTTICLLLGVIIAMLISNFIRKRT